jgi:hypothetical protein
LGFGSASSTSVCFCVLTQPIDGFTWANIDPLCAYPPVSTFVALTAAHVFNVTAPLAFTGSQRR